MRISRLLNRGMVMDDSLGGQPEHLLVDQLWEVGRRLLQMSIGK